MSWHCDLDCSKAGGLLTSWILLSEFNGKRTERVKWDSRCSWLLHSWIIFEDTLQLQLWWLSQQSQHRLDCRCFLSFEGTWWRDVSCCFGPCLSCLGRSSREIWSSRKMSPRRQRQLSEMHLASRFQWCRPTWKIPAARKVLVGLLKGFYLII